MTSESQNKLLARRFLEEVVNTGAVDRLGDFLAPEYVAPLLGIAGIDQARDHLLSFRHCYPDMAVTVEGQVAEGDIVAIARLHEMKGIGSRWRMGDCREM